MQHYQKYIWKSGDKITNDKLNNIQQGIEERSAVLKHIYPMTDGQLKIDATFEELINILESGKMIFFIYYDQTFKTLSIYYLFQLIQAQNISINNPANYTVYMVNTQSKVKIFTATSINYCLIEQEEGQHEGGAPR